VEVNIYSHLQALSKDIFVRGDYACRTLETIFHLMGYTSVLSDCNSNTTTLCLKNDFCFYLA